MWVWTHPRRLFSTDYISAPRGRWLLKFLHALEFDQALVTHIAIGVGGPLKNFKGQHLKLGLKFYTCACITLGIVGKTSKFYQLMWLIAGVIKWTLIRPPGTLVPKAFCFSRDFFFNSPQDLRAPSADRREILPHDQYLHQFYNACPKFRGALP